MPTLTSLSTNFFPTPKEGFTTTLASTISSGAATVPLNSISGYTNGAIATMIVDPTDGTKKQAFTGVVDTAGVQLTSVVWTEGTNQTHTAGSTVVDYVSATHLAQMTKGILIEHSQDGTHAPALITSRTEDTTPADGDFLLTSDVSASNALKKVTKQNLLSVQQIVSTNYTDVATGTTVLPTDNTIPQNTEGDQYMTQAITPKSTTNTLVIEATLLVTSNLAAGNAISVALFQDATAGALAATAVTNAGANYVCHLTLRHVMTAGTTSSTTFKIRAGVGAAGTLTFNGAAAARLFGGITLSNLRVIEYK